MKRNIHVIEANREPIYGDILLRHLWKNQPNECISWWRYKETIDIDSIKQYTTLNGSFRDIVSSFKVQNLYITNSEEIKAGDWCFDMILDKAFKCESERHAFDLNNQNGIEKVILTTDPKLIADGVQAIPNDFLEWFVKNPSFESVEVKSVILYEHKDTYRPYPSDCKNLTKTKVNYYLSIIPKEEPKQVQIIERFIANVKHQQQIPEFTNLIMMVSMDGKNWKRRNVIALSKGIYVTSAGIKTCAHTDEEFAAIDYWKFAKTI
jgi:hypothetical protein